MASSESCMRASLAIVALLCVGDGARHLLRAQVVDTTRMRVLWEVAEGIHATADSLGRLSGIAVDRNGFVYVSDASDARIWVFDSAGRSLPSFGRKGRGPGEFDSPTGIAIGPDGLLYVRDVHRISQFGADPATGRLTRYVASFMGPALSDWMSTRATRFDSRGRVYTPQFAVVNRTARSGVYLTYTSTGDLVDSVTVPPFPGAPSSTAWVRTSANGGRMLNGLNHVPFAPLPAWDITSRGTLIYTDGRSYALREVNRNGELVREYRRPVTPYAIPSRERSDSLAALRARLDSITAPRTQVLGVPSDVWDARLPQHYPAVMAAYAPADGKLWVRRWVPGGDRLSVFDVFHSDGRFERVVEIPRNVAVLPTPLLTLSGGAAIGIDPETGAHVIVRFARQERR